MQKIIDYSKVLKNEKWDEIELELHKYRKITIIAEHYEYSDGVEEYDFSAAEDTANLIMDNEDAPWQWELYDSNCDTKTGVCEFTYHNTNEQKIRGKIEA